MSDPTTITYSFYFLTGLIYAELILVCNSIFREGKWSCSAKAYISMVILWPLGAFLILFHFLIGAHDGIVKGIKRWGDQGK